MQLTDSLSADRSTRIALIHEGPCGPRTRCWRPACRAAWGDYRTVEWTARAVIARCHRAIYEDLNLDVALRLVASAS